MSICQHYQYDKLCLCRGQLQIIVKTDDKKINVELTSDGGPGLNVLTKGQEGSCGKKGVAAQTPNFYGDVFFFAVTFFLATAWISQIKDK